MYVLTESGSRDAAERVVDRLRGGCELIGSHPAIGRECPEIRRGLRKLVRGTYVIYSVTLSGEAEIVRILHQRQDVDDEFGLESSPWDVG